MMRLAAEGGCRGMIGDRTARLREGGCFMRAVLAIAVTTVMLAACGGGAGSPASPLSAGGNGEGPPQRPTSPPGGNDAAQRSALHVDFRARQVFPWHEHGNPQWVQAPDAPDAVLGRTVDYENIGVGVVEHTVVMGSGVYGLELADLHDLEEAGAHGAWALHYGRVNDGAGASVLTGLLTTDSVGRSRPVRRWGAVPPTVHVMPGATAEQVGETRLIVNHINEALPADWQLQWSDDRLDAPADDQAFHDGRIEVVFARSDRWPGAGDETLGLTQFRYEQEEIRAARIWVDPEAGFNRHKPGRLKVLAHELLHALGREHADPGRFRETILHAQVGEVPAIAPVLRQLDNEALLAVYGVLEAGQAAGEVSRALGSWEAASNHLGAVLAFGDAGLIGFGASERNGLARAWAVGTPLPGLPLSEAGSLDASAVWSGRLVGLTPASEPVAGDAAMTVGLGDLVGRLEFTNLEVWAADAAPGAIGSGTPWGGGELRYAIEVTGNGFRQTAASQDEGRIEGHFLGAGHEAITGVLRRPDLSAGFGGKRQF